jgi:hypothetical protein
MKAVSNLIHKYYIKKRDKIRQEEKGRHDVTMRRVRATIVVVEKQ